MIWLLSTALAGTTRIGLFVGNNLGFGTDEPLRYAEEEARKVARIFHEMGDVSRDRTTLLQGAKADQIGAALLEVEGQVREVEARGDDAMVVFYYSGHASREGLHVGGTLFPLDRLDRWLQGSGASVRVAFVDACESGSLARTRGGRPVEHVVVEVDDTLTSTGLAVVTSTGPLSAARESEQFGGGVFSRALMLGLRGSADQDNDGQITLDEAYRYAFEQTVSSTAQGSSGIQRPEYRYEITGVGRVVLTRVPDRAAALTLPEELEGVYTVVSVGTGQVVARVDKQPGESQRLSLPPGHYVVRKVRREDVLVAELDLVWGGDRWIEDAQMSSVPVGDPLARGGWRPRPLRIGAYGAGSSGLLVGSPPTLGGEVEVRARIARGLHLGLTAGHQLGRRVEWRGRLDASGTQVGLGLYAHRSFGRVEVWGGTGPLVSRVTQRIGTLNFEDEELDSIVYEAIQWVGGGFAAAGLTLQVGPGVGLDAGVRAQLLAAQVDEQPRGLFQAVPRLGVTLSFRTRRVARAPKDRR